MHRGLRRLGITVLALLVVLVLAGAGIVFLSVPVKGTSMEPTLRDGDRIMVSPFGSPPRVTRFSVVIGRFGQNGPEVVKRVIGLPGDRVEIEKVGVRDGIVRVQPGGTGPWLVVDNPAWRSRWGTLASNCCTTAGKMTNTVTAQIVPPGMLFLLGDNFERSDDSRAHGWAPASLVRSIATWRVYPLGAISRIADDVRLVPVN